MNTVVGRFNPADYVCLIIIYKNKLTETSKRLSRYRIRKETSSLFFWHRVPIRAEFVYDLVVITLRERTFANHHDGIVDTLERLADTRIAEAVTQVECVAALALHGIVANLLRRFHVENVGLTPVLFKQLRKDFLSYPVPAQGFGHGEIPEPVELRPRIDNRQSDKIPVFHVNGKIQRHRFHKPHQVGSRNLFLFRESGFVKASDLGILFVWI